MKRNYKEIFDKVTDKILPYAVVASLACCGGTMLRDYNADKEQEQIIEHYDNEINKLKDALDQRDEILDQYFVPAYDGEHQEVPEDMVDEETLEDKIYRTGTL